MPDSSKLEKLNRELEKSEKKLRKAINDEKALQHQLKQLTRKDVNSSRGIIYASTGEDFATVAGQKAKELDRKSTRLNSSH